MVSTVTNGNHPGQSPNVPLEWHGSRAFAMWACNLRGSFRGSELLENQISAAACAGC